MRIFINDITLPFVMSKESFMMVSLKGDKAKKLAQVMSNPTCMKILEHLAGKESTETQIAKELNIPLSTVHYNIQQLATAKLVLANEFHYSDKGREVTHYKLAKQYIIIAPDDDDPGFLDRLKKFVPVVIITISLAVVLKTMQFFTNSSATSLASPVERSIAPAAYDAAANQAIQTAAQTAADSGAQAGAQVGAQAVGGAATPMMAKMAAPLAAEAINNTVNETVSQTIDSVNQAAIDAANQAALNAPVDPAQFNSYTQTPWWQSPMIDYFLMGACFVILILIISETVSYWRSKKK